MQAGARRLGQQLARLGDFLLRRRLVALGKMVAEEQSRPDLQVRVRLTDENFQRGPRVAGAGVRVLAHAGGRSVDQSLCGVRISGERDRETDRDQRPCQSEECEWAEPLSV